MEVKCNAITFPIISLLSSHDRQFNKDVIDPNYPTYER